MDKYDPTKHVILHVEYQPGRVVPVHCYGWDQYQMVVNGDKLPDGTPTTKAVIVSGGK